LAATKLTVPPWAFRTTPKNFVRCGNVLFWGVKRA